MDQFVGCSTLFQIICELRVHFVGSVSYLASDPRAMDIGVSHIRLSELNQKIQSVLSNSFGGNSYWVVADVTNHTWRDQKDYHNFELVEKDPSSNRILARISAKAWGNGSLRIMNFERITGQKFTNNISVLVNLSVEFHPVYGLQVNVNDIDTNFTLGALEQQRQAVLERLVSDNPDVISRLGDRYVTKNSQLQLNAVIQRIAVISSKTSAGGEDFKHTLQNNPYGYKFTVDNYHTVVQGENNADQFLAKIIEVFNSGKTYDVVVITRGGGAQTDFLIFDNYYIGRAIARFPIPIITGIGHQKNETIADLMAHTQTKTPTKAAEFIIFHNKSYEDAIVAVQRKIIIKAQQMFSSNFQALSSNNMRIINSTRNILSQNKENLSDVRQETINSAKAILFNNQRSIVSLASQIISKPKIILYNRINDVKNTIGNLATFTHQFFKNKSGYLGHHSSVVRIMRPENILRKGFAIIRSGDRIISNADSIVSGSEIEVILSKSRLNATVNRKTKNDGSESDL